nr:putative per os infectivity factor PIF5 isoform 2 [Microplitis mediator]
MGFLKSVAKKTRKIFTKIADALRPSKSNPFKVLQSADLKIHADSLLKNFDLHEKVHLRSIEGVHVEVKRIGGEVHINSHAWQEISLEMESGRIGKFCDRLSLRSSLSHVDELKLREVHFEHVPAKILADIDESFAIHSKKFGDIGTTNLKNAELKLSGKSKSKIVSKFVKAGLIITGVAIGVGVTFKSVVSELHKAEGCFLYEGINKTSCKLTDRSCAYRDTSDKIQPCDKAAFKQFFDIGMNTNLNLVIRKILQDPVKTEKLKSDLKVTEINVDKLEKFIEDHYDEINNLYPLDKRPTILDPCMLFKDSEKPSCVACDSSAPMNSIRYLDTSDLTLNQKPYCSDDPSVLKALGLTLGQGIHGLMDGLEVTSIFGNFFQYIMYAIVGFILLCGVGYAISFLRKNKGDDDDEVSYSKLENEKD